MTARPYHFATFFDSDGVRYADPCYCDENRDHPYKEVTS